MKIRVSGEIIPNDYAWIYDLFEVDYFSPGKLADALKEADPADRELIVEINSPGGYVFSGFEIYSELRNLQAQGWHVEAHVIALAASAATTIMAACDTVLCSPVAQIMVHLPMTITEGNRYDHRESIDVLKSLEESILNGYVMKSAGKADRERLRKAMEKSTWMPAQEAIGLGLVDGILGDPEEVLMVAVDVGALAGQVVNSLQAGMGQTFEDLMARYEAGVRNGTLQADPLHPIAKATAPAEVLEGITNFEPEPAPDPSNPGWQMQAWIDLERQRYQI